MIIRFLHWVVKKLGYELKSLRTRNEISAKDDSKSDFSEMHLSIISSVSQYTMTSPERLYGLIEAVKYVENNNIKGDIVECGVWKGGSMMAAALTLISCESKERKIFLFDTFSDGMTEPGSDEHDFRGQNAKQVLDIWEKHNSYPSLESVKDNLVSTGYPVDKLIFIEGKVEDTLPKNLPEKISILRLDTDWYESTKLELNYLFPLLSDDGILIIDDYGHWSGAKRAVDEYFEEKKITIFLNRLDYTGRIAVKSRNLK